MDYRSNIWKLYVYKFFSSLHFIGGVLVPFFLDWGKISYIQMMFLQSWFVIWVTLLEVPTGAVADKFGRKTSVVIGSLSFVIASIIYSSMPNYLIFLLGEFLWALSYALISGADVAILYDTLKEIKKEDKSKTVLAIFNSFNLIGIAIAAPLGSIIGSQFGLNIPTRAMAIPFFVAAMFSLSLKEPHYKKESESQRYLKVLKEGVSYFLKHKNLRILAFDFISVYVLSFFIVWTYQPILLDLGMALKYIGIVHGLAAFFEIIVMLSFPLFEKALGSKKRFIFFTSIVLSGSFFILSAANNIYVASVFAIIIFSFGFTRKVLFQNYFNKFIESKNRATVLSSISMFETLARAVVYPLIGVIIQYSRSIGLLIIGISILVVSLFSKIEEGILLD